ncbi:Phage protein [Yersinia phage fEV-1]|nr:Phage protein [Yersinia phage fEV-1]
MQFKVKGILSYPHLFTPRSVNPGDDPKFSASILLRKGDPQIQQVQQIIATEKANGWPNGFPHNGKEFMKDGAVAFPNDAAMHNYMIISSNAKADSKPHLVDAHMQPVMNQSDAFAGAVVWAALNSFTYNQPVNKGVGCGLNGIMLTGEEGELGRLDGRPTVEGMFGDVAAGGAPSPAAAPMAPAAPAAPVAPPAAPVHQMTAAANGLTREQYHAAGWSDEQLIQNGLMLPPNGVAPSFA